MSLYFTESGNPNGETIVYLHGAGMAGWSWYGVTELLPDYHHMVLDLPGHGNSHHVQAESLASMANIVADFIAETVPEGKAHVVGLSLGGIMTIEMMQTRPEILRSAVVSGVNTIPLKFMTKLMVNLTLPFLKSEFLIRQNARLFQLDEQSTQAYFTSIKQLDMTTLKHIMPEIEVYEPAEGLSEIDLPVLYVAGSAEDRINVDSVSVLANAMPHGVGVLAPKMHHGWSGEDPQLFANMVDQWVKSREIADGLEIVVDKRAELETV